MDDEHKIDSLKAPEDQCAELLMRNRERLLTMCAYSCKGHVEEANDLLQDIMLSVWRLWDTLRPDATDGEKDAWLISKSRTVIHDFLRHKRLQWIQGGTDTTVDTDDDLQAQRDRIDELISCLNAEEREYIELQLNGYNKSEIAIIKNLKPATVRKRIERIYKKIKKMQQFVKK